MGRRAHIARGHSEVRAKCACLPPAVPVYWRHRPPQMIRWTTGVCGHCAVQYSMIRGQISSLGRSNCAITAARQTHATGLPSRPTSWAQLTTTEHMAVISLAIRRCGAALRIQREARASCVLTDPALHCPTLLEVSDGGHGVRSPLLQTLLASCGARRDSSTFLTAVVRSGGMVHELRCVTSRGPVAYGVP